VRATAAGYREPVTDLEPQVQQQLVVDRTVRDEDDPRRQR
jgi:hypothetical protein